MVELEERPTAAFLRPDMRQSIAAAERALLADPNHIIQPPTRHIFAQGLYAREVCLPAGWAGVGKVHCQEHLFMVTKGELSVLTDDGPVRVQAPYVLVTKPGAKRVMYAHEDTVLMTVHATTETDVEKLEADLVVNSFEEFDIKLLASKGD